MWIKDSNGNLINMSMVSSIDNRSYGYSNTEGKIDNRIAIYGSAEVPMNTYQFKSAERCQEIVDEIQSHIEFVEYTKSYNTATNYKNDWESIQTYKVVYEMLKE